MGKVITLGLQKGGVSKSTTTGILGYLLSINGFKTLVIDMDSQGNVTELLTDQSSNEFIGKSVYEAIIYKSAQKYIYKISETLDLLPANNYLALYGMWMHTKKMMKLDTDEPYQDTVQFEGHQYKQLDLMLEEVRNDYDYVLIDTPPSLSEQTISSLVASDACIVMYECSKFCYSAIPNFMETIEVARNVSSHAVDILGILRTLNDKRRTDAKLFNEAIQEDYPDLVFDTIITRKASTGRVPFYGFVDNSELNDAIAQFKDFYDELFIRMNNKWGIKS